MYVYWYRRGEEVVNIEAHLFPPSVSHSPNCVEMIK